MSAKRQYISTRFVSESSKRHVSLSSKTNINFFFAGGEVRGCALKVK